MASKHGHMTLLRRAQKRQKAGMLREAQADLERASALMIGHPERPRVLAWGKALEARIKTRAFWCLAHGPVSIGVATEPDERVVSLQ